MARTKKPVTTEKPVAKRRGRKPKEKKQELSDWAKLQFYILYSFAKQTGRDFDAVITEAVQQYVEKNSKIISRKGKAQ